jgi:hypothetical protein
MLTVVRCIYQLHQPLFPYQPGGDGGLEDIGLQAFFVAIVNDEQVCIAMLAVCCCLFD